ncbi:MAG TPA: GSU2403 family nucleotidyltransferase fold protein [Chlamydiales bacterium]|nr:GSU2403 family nucleotidyltransferase fold protein [Chlamydiales bacterium]
MAVELENENRIISEFLQIIGPWRDHIVIGGGYAPIIYKLYLADQRLENSPVGTTDIDSLIPRKVPEVSQKNIARHLQEAGFSPVFRDYDQPATEAYVREMNGLEVEIEFLTDSNTRNGKTKNVIISGIVAQPLSYLVLSLLMTLEFKTDSGEVGRVVSPGAWLFHKGLTFTRRKRPAKIHKDLYGIWYVATQLGSFSEQAIREVHFLAEQHPKWFKTFQENLRHWIKHATPLEWAKLETQEPSGKLKRLHFEGTVNRLVKVISQTKKPKDTLIDFFNRAPFSDEDLDVTRD